jgi:sugar O-acyltransferase (sialic acid O-acetyltransferase NeuD family)
LTSINRSFVKMKEKIILIGCGQHANVALYNIHEQQKYEVIAFLDSDETKTGTNYNGIEVIGTYDQDLHKLMIELGTNKFFISFGNMKYRRTVFELFVSNGWEPVNIIHPNAVVSPNAKIGKGVLIECGCLVTPNPTIGDNVVVNTGSQVNHDNIIENHVYIASGVILSGSVTIKENSLIDDGVIVALGRKVGKNCIIGAGSVVTKDTLENCIYYGNPAKFVRNNDKY